MQHEFHVERTPNKLVAEIVYNSWHSKTYCRHTDCDAQKEHLRAFMSITSKVWRSIKRKIDTWHRHEFRVERDHYCGAEPRWFYVCVEAEFRRDKCIRATIHVQGGAKWWFKIDYDDEDPEYPYGKVIITYDGCFSKEYIMNFINHMASGDAGFFIN